MKLEQRPDRRAVILVPDPADDPADLEDLVHDELLRAREAGEPAPRLFVLDLSAARDAPRWMKAAGPELPDVSLRLALGDQGFLVARMLGLTAEYEWYQSVEAALAGGA